MPLANNPLSFSDSFGLDVYLCSQPAFGIPWNPIDHHWLKTDTIEAGMGGTRGNVPGNDIGDMPGDPVQVLNHRGRSTEPGASCRNIDGVDESKVNEALQLDRSLGRWGPTNQWFSAVQRIWRKHGLQPHRLERHLVYNDPDFEAKVADVIGLYFNPNTDPLYLPVKGDEGNAGSCSA